MPKAARRRTHSRSNRSNRTKSRSGTRRNKGRRTTQRRQKRSQHFAALPGSFYETFTKQNDSPETQKIWELIKQICLQTPGVSLISLDSANSMTWRFQRNMRSSALFWDKLGEYQTEYNFYIMDATIARNIYTKQASSGWFGVGSESAPILAISVTGLNNHVDD